MMTGAVMVLTQTDQYFFNIIFAFYRKCKSIEFAALILEISVTLLFYSLICIIPL
jgi:hypothetical protein